MPTRLPLLRGRAYDGGSYGSPRSGPRRTAPPRTPSLHAATLIAQLDTIEARAQLRPAGARDETASREVIVIEIEDDGAVDPKSLASKREGVDLVGADETTGTIVLDAPTAALPHLRQKIADYADDAKATPGGTRANEAAIAPLKTIAPATVDTLGTAWLGALAVERTEAQWFELGCRGGRHRPQAESANSEHQIHHQLRRLGALPPGVALRSFVAAERIYFFVRTTLDVLVKLVDAVDCVFEVEPVPREVLTWLLFEEQPARELRAFALERPSPTAPSVVLIDSGIATEHPLLKPAILSSASVLPGVESPVDTLGHGTKMAGVALYDDLEGAVTAGRARAPHWLQSVRILQEEGTGTAVDEYAYLWPDMTREAIERAETDDPVQRPRAYVMAVTRRSAPDGPTLWSQAVDQLAFNEGRGRLICVSAGNPHDSRWRVLATDYPQGQLTERLHDPAIAGNALTVGAYTTKTRLPPDGDYDGARVAAAQGGISIFTSTGSAARSAKPDVVLEGGNLALSGDVHDQNVATLATLTTSHRWTLGRPLALISMTSEAVARAGRMAARIWSEDHDLRPETVRGLIVHSASWTATMQEQFASKPDLLSACGYGVPNVDIAVECARDRATVIVEDELPNAVAVEIPPPPGSRRRRPRTEAHRPLKLFRLPLPDDLANETGDAELRVTLSYCPEPNRFRRTLIYGMELRWEMQGPLESEPDFLDRINAKRSARASRVGGGGLVNRPHTGSHGRWAIRSAAVERSRVTAGAAPPRISPVRNFWPSSPSTDGGKAATPFASRRSDSASS